MRWDEFERKASSAIGHEHGWKRIYADQVGLPDCVVLQRWKKSGSVPPEAAKSLSRLRHEPVSRVRQNWTFEEYGRIEHLSRPREDGTYLSDTRIREILCHELGRPVTLGNVKRAKLNLRRGIEKSGLTITRPDKRRRSQKDEYPEDAIIKSVEMMLKA